jgi:hypothetical protein
MTAQEIGREAGLGRIEDLAIPINAQQGLLYEWVSPVCTIGSNYSLKVWLAKVVERLLGNLPGSEQGPGRRRNDRWPSSR